MIKELSVERITGENFADYGTLITKRGNEINKELDSDIFNLRSHIGISYFDDEVVFNLLEVLDRGNEFSCLERHVDTEELFMALDRDVIVLVGKPDNDKKIPDPDTVKAFHMSAGEGMLMKKGTWHWIPYPVGADKADMLVVFKKGTLDEDLVVADLEEEKNITFTVKK